MEKTTYISTYVDNVADSDREIIRDLMESDGRFSAIEFMPYYDAETKTDGTFLYFDYTSSESPETALVVLEDLFSDYPFSVE